MEETIKILIYIHAFFGGIGLISGIGSIVVKKGNSLHKKLGKAFSYAMILSSLLSLVVAQMPNHKNLYLFLIGILTIYMVLAGNRALTFKNKSKTQADYIDKTISGSMLVISLIMIAIGVVSMIQKIDNSVLYLFFGALGTLMTIKDFQTFKKFTKNKNAWLISHLGRMTGALIASLTAFLVAGLSLGSLLIWMLPTVLGTIYIVYWSRKLKAKTATKAL